MIRRLLLTAAVAGVTIVTGTTFTIQDTKVGVIEASSGSVAQYDMAVHSGLQLAVGEINAANGINSSKVMLVIEGKQDKKEEAINVFKKLIFQDEVVMVFGLTLSNSARAADPIT